jgi:hypothetical protein
MKFRIAPLPAAGLAVLAAINAWLLAGIADAMFSPDEQPLGAPMEWSPKLPDPGEGFVDFKPIEAASETLRHPLFFKTRAPLVPRPPPPPPKPEPAPIIQADPGLVLGGVVIDRDIRKAYLLSKDDPRGAWVSEGENFMGWKIVSVEGASAKLQQSGRMLELQLYPQ